MQVSPLARLATTLAHSFSPVVTYTPSSSELRVDAQAGQRCRRRLVERVDGGKQAGGNKTCSIYGLAAHGDVSRGRGQGARTGRRSESAQVRLPSPSPLVRRRPRRTVMSDPRARHSAGEGQPFDDDEDKEDSDEEEETDTGSDSDSFDEQTWWVACHAHPSSAAAGLWGWAAAARALGEVVLTSCAPQDLLVLRPPWQRVLLRRGEGVHT